MGTASPLAPYYLPLQFASLPAYRRSGLNPARWAEEQFWLEVVIAPRAGADFGAGCQQALAAIDNLPLQVKDLLRGTIDQIRMERADAFAMGTLGTWRDGVLRINADWALLPPLQSHRSQPLFARRLMRSTLIHECGHALAEDRRGGLPMGSLLHLLAASGWLPWPAADPVPYRLVNGSAEKLAEHFRRRLRMVDPRWDAGLALGDPGMGTPSQFEHDLVWQATPGLPPGTGNARTVGLLAPTQLGRELLAAATDGTLASDLARVGLTLPQVRQAVSRHRPVSPYSEELVAETPAEVFRSLYDSPRPCLEASPALRAGDRLLAGPWRSAEMALGPREPARQPGQRPLISLPLR